GDVLAASPGDWKGTGLSFGYQWQRWSSADGWVDIAGATGAKYTVVKADVDRKLRVVVTASSGDGSVQAASAGTDLVASGQTVQVASAGPQASGDGPAPQLVVDREQRTVQVHYGAKIVVTGRLVDADGAPIADADVDVFEQVSVVGAPWKKVATVKTDGQGGYVYRPVTQGSRVLRFAYSARRDSGDYRATREVVISVTAGMSIKAVRKSIGSRGLIHLKGRVRAKPMPVAGTWVEVQVLDAGVWRTIGTRKTSKTGRWSFKHRVRSVSRVTFAFRARLRPVANVPAAESKSVPVKVRVR
ncbi:MAG: carboxypeptidase regulatory-like domain-containing protein, partial [Solirubrobacteraceae bacterium]|nr:carboxypeptidase regulatory-like domain-containing protein [Solirubrobacteraceae bacterium]